MADSSRWFRFRQQPATVPDLDQRPDPDPDPDQAAPAPVPAAVPAGPRGERVKTVAVRLSPEEHAAWVAAAEAEGRGQMGRWVRETVTARLANRPVTAPAVGLEGAREMRAELARVGSNLNQIAKGLNIAALGGGTAPGAEEITRNLAEVRELLGSVRDELRGR